MWKAQSICSAPFLSYSYSFAIFFIIVLYSTIELGRSGFYGFVDGGVFYPDEIYTASYLSAILVCAY